MTELIVVEKIAEWQRLKTLVLDSVSSPITRRVYNMALDEFIDWYHQEPRPGFTKATVSAWRVSLEARGLGSSSIIIRMSAIRKLAVEAADNGLRSPRFTGRNTWPSAKPAAEVQASIATFTQVGIGMVRMRLCLPTRSTMHHRP